jgi:hypothetical protein
MVAMTVGFLCSTMFSWRQGQVYPDQITYTLHFRVAGVLAAVVIPTMDYGLNVTSHYGYGPFYQIVRNLGYLKG